MNFSYGKWFNDTPLIEFASDNPPLYLLLEDMVLQDGNWNVDRFSPYLPQNICQAITSFNFSLSEEEDLLIWNSDPNGAFTSKSAWNYIWSLNCPVDWAKFVWQPDILIKISIFGWKSFRHPTF